MGLIYNARPIRQRVESASIMNREHHEHHDGSCGTTFALDCHDPKLYASTFTPDGVLDYGTGDVRGREAIIKVIAGMPGNRPAPAR
jgi:hypothetical protein